MLAAYGVNVQTRGTIPYVSMQSQHGAGGALCKSVQPRRCKLRRHTDQTPRLALHLGFAEALSDDGSLTGRGAPVVRGAVTGVMTAIGGLGHTLPYLVPDNWPNAFWIATGFSGIVVFIELWVIAYIQAHYMSTRFVQAALKVVFGGVLVLATGILIGGA